MKNPNIIVLGGGYLGRKLATGLDCQLVDKRIINYDDIRESLDWPEGTKYPVLINCIGKTGRPNVDWCEDHVPETFHSNVEVPYMLATYCSMYGVKLVHISSGCIYSGAGAFTEEDEPNFQGSYYSHSKYVSERMLLGHEKYGLGLLILRIRMPVDSEVSDRNLINKLLKYDKIITAENSITVIPDFVDLVGKLIEKDVFGIVNCVNPEPVYHHQIISMYEFEAGVNLGKQYIKPEELDVKAPRSNCVLVDKRLQELGLRMTPTIESLQSIIREYVKNERGHH